MELAWYEARLARAFPNATEHELAWEISLVRGYARIHAVALLNGEACIWPDPRLSTTGRYLLQVADLVRDVRQHGIPCDL